MTYKEALDLLLNHFLEEKDRPVEITNALWQIKNLVNDYDSFDIASKLELAKRDDKIKELKKQLAQSKNDYSILEEQIENQTGLNKELSEKLNTLKADLRQELERVGISSKPVLTTTKVYQEQPEMKECILFYKEDLDELLGE